MNSTTQPINDRRAAVMAAVLVTAVVVVVGFGSGIGAVLSRNAAAPTRSFQVSPGIVTPIQTASGATDGGIASGVAHAVSRLRVSAGPSHATPLAHGGASASPADTSTCAGEPLSTAMLTPFLIHFNAAHLETSPGQQVSDATNVDQYTKTHTVMFEAMFAPLFNLVLGSPAALNPFFVHFNAAHLEASPGQQVSDATNVDQYAKTHTVMIENMLAPLSSGMTAAGC